MTDKRIDIASVRAYAEASRERLVALCAALVAARSAQPVGDTIAPIAVLVECLRGAGLDVRLVASAPGKPNLVCSFEGSGPGPTLVLNGHVDTLDPGDERTWSVPVHELVRRDGRLSGLGIGNMKAGVAALTLAFLGLYERRSEITGRIVLTAVADEVVFGPDGAAFLLDSEPDLAGDLLINAEGPGAMNLAVAEKGLLWLSVEAEAPPGQGMLTRVGTSAIARLARLLHEIDGWNATQAIPPGDMLALLPHVGEHGLRLSVNPGTIEGGHFVSQVAVRARAEIDFRIPPGMTIDAVEAKVRALAEEIGDISVRRIKGWNPNWTATDHPLCRAMLSASAAVRATAALPVVRLPASDASRWRARGVPAICYGPQLELASGIDDTVIENDVVDCVAVYMIAALSLSVSHP